MQWEDPEGFAFPKITTVMSHSLYEYFKFNCISYSHHTGWFNYCKTMQWLAHSYTFCQASDVLYWILLYGRLRLKCLFPYSNLVGFPFSPCHLFWFFFLTFNYPLGQPEQCPVKLSLSSGLLPKVKSKKACSKPLGLNKLRKYFMLRNSSHGWQSLHSLAKNKKLNTSITYPRALKRCHFTTTGKQVAIAVRWTERLISRVLLCGNQSKNQ